MKKTITMYTFHCTRCNNTLTVSKPFPMRHCPFCGDCLDEDDRKKIYECIRTGYKGYDS